MRKVELLCIGGLKFRELKPVEQMFVKRINAHFNFSITRLKDIGLNDERLVREKEAEKIIRHLNPDDVVIGLDEGGKEMNSAEFAGLLSRQIDRARNRIVFIVGGYSGLSGTLDDYIDLKISFSRLTFSHDIFRIVFLEQLYRAITIMKGITYHR
jgi:23S rRNA (pseudouridine1915-N3)-methyltransferase